MEMTDKNLQGKSNIQTEKLQSCNFLRQKPLRKRGNMLNTPDHHLKNTFSASQKRLGRILPT
jgi:hypothetical protein